MDIYVVSNPNETKFQRFKRKTVTRAEDVIDWAKRNKDAILVLAPVIIGGTATIVKVVGKRMNLHKTEELKNLYCYDRSLGHYWALRRELSNAEWLEIDKRKKCGERLSDILAELKVLK